MADQGRPQGRDRRVIGTGKGVHKRGEGLGTGPVGSSDGYAGKKPSESSSGGGSGTPGKRGGGMGLIGILIAMVVNFFLGSALMDFVISCLGVVIFTGLTAYDTQRLRIFGSDAPMGDEVALRRGAILGALTLYLDFINLFLMLLRIFGRRR